MKLKASNRIAFRFTPIQNAGMKQFLKRHRFDIFLAIICVFDVIAFSKFSALCEIATGAMIVGMILDHKRQESTDH